MKIAKTLFLPLLAASLFACNGGGGGVSLQSVYNEITENGSQNTLFMKIGSDGSYLSFDTNPLDISDYYSSSYTDLAHQTVQKCGFTEATWDAMLHTRALDGMQTEQTAKIKARWTYHPSHGLECTFSYLS